MKLSKDQIEAIVSKIANEADKKIRAEREAWEKLPDVKKEAKKYVALVEKLPEIVQDKIRGYGNKLPDEADYIRLIINARGYETKTERVDRNDLRDKIQIASINATDLSDLKKALGINF